MSQIKKVDMAGKVTTLWVREDKPHIIHRTDGPAIIWDDGSEFWYYNGAMMRMDGPAVTYADGRTGWCYKGREYSFDNWCIKTKKKSQDILHLKLKYKIS